MKRKRRRWRSVAEVNALLEKETREATDRFLREKLKRKRQEETERLKPWKELGINSGAFAAQQACNRQKLLATMSRRKMAS